MEKSLSFSDVLVGMGIFTIELVKVAVLRFTFIIYVMLISLLIFPLFAGFIVNVLFLAIPLMYVVFAIPACVFGFCLAVFMIMFRAHIHRGGVLHIVFAALFSPVVVCMSWYIVKPEDLVGLQSLFSVEHMRAGAENIGRILKAIILFLLALYVACLCFGGGAIAGFLKPKIIKDLLVAPTSVRQQLMAYKRKLAAK